MTIKFKQSQKKQHSSEETKKSSQDVHTKLKLLAEYKWQNTSFFCVYG